MVGSNILLSTVVQQLVEILVFLQKMNLRYGCESWAIRKAKHQKIEAFELWYWIRLLRVPWTARRSNQSVQKDINPEHSLKGLMLKLKLQYFGHLMGRADSLETILIWERLRKGDRDDRG